MTPVVLRAGPYRCYFYSQEPDEPPHVHVDRDACTAKRWLDPVAVAYAIGFRPHELRAVERLVQDHRSTLLEAWYGQFPPTAGERVVDVRCTDDALVVDLADGRTISTPLAWYPRLLHATPAQRARWEPAGGGYGVHWPDLDEDLSVRGMLRGVPAAPGTWPMPATTA